MAMRPMTDDRRPPMMLVMLVMPMFPMIPMVARDRYLRERADPGDRLPFVP